MNHNSSNHNKGNHNSSNHNSSNHKGNNKPTTFRIFKISHIQNERIAATKYMRGASRRRWA